MDANRELDILNHGIMLSYSITQADKAKQRQYLPQILQAQAMVEQTSKESHLELKRLTLEAINHTINFIKTGRYLDAKLNEVTGKKYLKELERLQQILEENENQ